jgi:hypothetical protein
MAFTIEVRATNTEGSDVESWEVVVREERAIRFPLDAGAEGWALATWRSGPYEPGTMVWESSGGNPGGNLHAAGSGDSNNLDTCTREGGIATRGVSTAGLSAVRIEFDVIAALGVPPGASAAGNCADLEGTSEDKLVVYYSVSGAGGPWTVAAIVSEGALPSAWRREVADLSGVAAAEDNPAFAVRFQWQFNHRLDGGRIDNIAILGGAPPGGPGTFRRGDPNGDGFLEVSDAVYLLRKLFGGELPGLACQKSADLNDDGALNITDPLRLLNYLLLGGAQPASPFGACGLDPTPDGLTCASYPVCE